MRRSSDPLSRLMLLEMAQAGAQLAEPAETRLAKSHCRGPISQS